MILILSLSLLHACAEEVSPRNQGARNATISPQPIVGPTFPSTPFPVNPITPEQPTSPSNFSLGSGGPSGEIEERFRSSNGKSSRYKTVIPQDISSTKAYGLNIHLHGDGGGDYSWLFRPNVEIAKEHGLIGIVVMAPNFEKRWYNDGVANATFLHELIQEDLAKKYNIDMNRVYFSGVSGGSQFLTGQFIPKYGHHYKSGAVLLCGGPHNWGRSLEGGDDWKSQFKLYWYTSTGDFLYSQVKDGIEYYKNNGFDVDSDIRPFGSHCKFDGGIEGALREKLAKVVSQN